MWYCIGPSIKIHLDLVQLPVKWGQNWGDNYISALLDKDYNICNNTSLIINFS